VQESNGEIGGFDESIMQEMMKELEGMMGSGDMEDLFGGVLNQLVNKELLYEPMKELAEKYPQWLEQNSKTIESTERDRFVKQHQIVVQIVRIFDTVESDEPSAEESQKIIDLMQEVKQC
jgi:peroxin-19